MQAARSGYAGHALQAIRVGLATAVVALLGCSSGAPGEPEGVVSSELTTGPVQLVVQSSLKCLDVVSGMAAQETCSTSVATQSWTFKAVTGGYQIVSTSNPGVCLNIPGASTSKGTLAAVSACSANGVAGEIWTTTTSGNSYELVAAFDKQCLDISGASGSNGASALEWTCSNASNQRWQLVALPASEAGAGAPDAGSDARDAAPDAVADAPAESASDASDGAVDAAPDVSVDAAPDVSEAAAPPPPPADAGGGSSLPTNTAVTLVAQNSGQCVDISISNGQPLQEPCAGTPTQKWTFVPVSGGYQIASVANSGQCLLITGGSNTPGQNAAVAACSSGGAPGDVWTAHSAGANFTIVNGASGQCLDISGNTSNIGASIDQYTCNGNANQTFAVTVPPAPPPPASVPTGTPFALVAQNSSKCIDIVSGSATQEACNGSATQAWTFKTVTGGYQILSAASPGQCINLPGASTTAGQNLAVSSCSSTGTAGEVWSPQLKTGSLYELVNPNSTLCADVANASGANGASVLQWTCNAASNQLWALQPTSVPDASAPPPPPDAGAAPDAEAGAPEASADAPPDVTEAAAPPPADASEAASPPPPPPPPPPVDSGSPGATFPTNTAVTLVAQNSGKCVDMSISNSQPLQEVCAGTPTQKWILVPVSGGYQIESAQSPTLCLLIANGSHTAGQNATVAACSSGGAPGDVWTPTTAGSNYTIVNAASSQCLDVSGNTSNNGAAIDQYNCNGNANQTFAITAPPAPPPPASVPTGTTVTLVAQNSGKCMDIVSGNATQETCSGAATQAWTFQSVSGGYQILSVANPATCINLPSASTSPGQDLAVSTCSTTGTAGEVWSPQLETGGVYELVNPNSTLCADVANGSGADGTPVLQWTCGGANNQLWAITATSVADAGPPPPPPPPPADASADTGADASAPPPSDAGPGTVPTTATVQIQAQNSGLCIDIVSGKPEQETCSHSTSQSWSFKSVAGGFQIVSAANAANCLVIPGGTSALSTVGAIVACSANGAPGDTWTSAIVGNDFSFTNTSSKLCLDVNGGSGSPGATLDQWTCNGNSNQTFGFIYPPTPATVPTGVAVSISSVNGGNCLDLNEGAGLQEPCWGSGSQLWSFKAVTGGYQIVTAGNPSQCMTLPGGSATPGQTVSVTTCSAAGVPGEVWTPIASGSNISLVNNASGQCLDVANNTTTAGAAIDQYTCNGQTNQAWIVTSAGALPNPQVDGQWSPIYDTQSIAVAAAMMPSGKIVTWASWAPDNWGMTGGMNQTYTSIVDPATLTSTEVLVTQTTHDMFCPGTSMLPDGRLFVNGGGPDTANTSIYDGSSSTWSADAVMDEGRWYNVSVTLPSGQVFTIGGNRITGLDGNGELYTPGSGWKFVPNALLSPLLTGANESNRAMEHPRLLVAPNGKIFVPGPNPNMYWYDLTGSGTVTAAGTRGDDAFSQNDATVMFDVGKILKAGGNTNYGWDQDGYVSSTTPSSASSYVIDINSGNTPTVTKVAPLNHKRAYATPVVLPDGTVMVAGGLDNGSVFTDVGSVFPPELYNPATQTWRDLPPVWVPRTYHSVAVLLPDGRVFVGGGGLCGSGCPNNHSNYQMYSPAYLFQAGRPTIASAPATVSWGATFPVTTTGTVTSFSLVRLSSTTHTVNTDQRWMAASFTGSNGSYTLTAPANGNLAPPGVYMLFALNGGVPSVASMVKIGP